MSCIYEVLFPVQEGSGFKSWLRPFCAEFACSRFHVSIFYGHSGLLPQSKDLLGEMRSPNWWIVVCLCQPCDRPGPLQGGPRLSRHRLGWAPADSCHQAWIEQVEDRWMISQKYVFNYCLLGRLAKSPVTLVWFFISKSHTKNWKTSHCLIDKSRYRYTDIPPIFKKEFFTISFLTAAFNYMNNTWTHETVDRILFIIFEMSVCSVIT